MSVSEVWLVAAGQYADRRPLAVFDDAGAAQVWADRWTVANLDRIGSEDNRASVDLRRLLYNPTEVAQ